ncbi:uncharacterized protein N7525_009360 [Penicillium rubens]|uniref:uncharacterized protein n=1 Tax=Penicillium rubens TaxID=1108849 RepID=UPI002A5A4D15|nr:uncharacterized protein N7525_009360 [Penicillium rubens]KAJ5831107.1 hypothetical protein N7525_009360 [Penicillium rubens]KAJ5854654.1 hypothetical protein N7534_007197 [Penicillium rubens]
MRLQLPEEERYWFERISPYTTTGSLSHLNYFAQSSPKQKRPSTVLSILISPHNVAFVELSQHRPR